jgi:hypothetical protein
VIAENCRQCDGRGGGCRIRKDRWIGWNLSGSALNQSPPDEGVASVVVTHAQLSACGAETATGNGAGVGLPGQRAQRGRRTGAERGTPTSGGVTAMVSRSCGPGIVRDVTFAPHPAMADDGASAPHAKQAKSPQARQSRSFPELTRRNKLVAASKSTLRALRRSESATSTQACKLLNRPTAIKR